MSDMEEESEDEKPIIEEDYYTFLNVPRDASNEEINSAYRRMSKIYHPDKHKDPNKKKDAETLFHKTKKAYEVLSDPHKRAIYDALGIKGLETEGWEIIHRTKTPQEIREEYERLARERAEQRQQQTSNPRGTFTINVNATELFSQEDKDQDYDDIDLPLVEISSMAVSQSIEVPVTVRDIVTIGGDITNRNGTGSGTFNLSGRRLLENNKWLEVDVSFGEGPVLGVKHFRPLTQHIFGTGLCQFQFLDSGLRPTFECTLAMQLAERTMGYMAYRMGGQSSLTTSIAHNTENVSVSGAVTLGIPHSFISCHFAYNFKHHKVKLRTAVKAGTTGVLFEYGAEKKVSPQTSLSAAVILGVPSGIRVKLKIVRGTQTYLIPFHLCEEPMPAPIFYGTFVPLVAYVIIKYTIIDPMLSEQKEINKERKKESNKNRLNEMKREAAAAVKLMDATFARIRSEEESRKGLVIVKALYGRLVTLTQTSKDGPPTDEVIDVTIPLQCLVRDSKLTLHDNSKSQLAGFYDPCVGEDKALFVQYLFHSHLHEVVSPDTDHFRIPKQSHRLNAT